MKKWTSFCYFSFFSLSAFDYFFRAATKLGNKTKLFSWKSSNHHRDVYFFFLAQTKYSNIFLNFQFLSQNRSIRLSTIRSWKEKLFFFFCLDVLSLAFFFSFGVLFALSGIMVVDFFSLFDEYFKIYEFFFRSHLIFAFIFAHTHAHHNHHDPKSVSNFLPYMFSFTLFFFECQHFSACSLFLKKSWQFWWWWRNKFWKLFFWKVRGNLFLCSHHHHHQTHMHID